MLNLNFEARRHGQTTRQIPLGGVEATVMMWMGAAWLVLLRGKVIRRVEARPSRRKSMGPHFRSVRLQVSGRKGAKAQRLEGAYGGCG